MADGPEILNKWMDRSRRSDRQAFGLLASAIQDTLFRFALAQGLQAADAAEAVQESLLRAYDRRRTWRPGSDARAWLMGIAMNVIREMRRRRAPAGLDPSVLEWAARPAEPPAEDEVEPARLAAALEALPPRQREAVACRYLRQMSGRQIAEVMGCAEGTVRATLSAAIGNLRKILRRDATPPNGGTYERQR